MPIKRSRPKPLKGLPGIFEDGPGRYLVVAWWTQPNGKRRKSEKVVEGSLSIALAAREEMLATREVSEPRQSRQRLSDYAAKWLEVHSRRLAPSTRERYLLDVAHIQVGLGGLYVDAVGPADVRGWLSSQKGSPATINTRLRTLRQCFGAAVADGLLTSNPAKAVRPLHEGRTKGRRGRSLEPEEFSRFVEAARDPDNLVEPGRRDSHKVAADLARVIVVLAWSGMRRGEVLALRWSDLVDGELHVDRAVWNGRERDATKTDDPRRVVVVTPLADVLDEQRRWLLETQHPGLESGLIFPASPRQARAGASRRGGALRWHRSSSCVDLPIRRLVDLASVPDISAHSLRRTFEDLGRRAGVDQLVRRAVAGWRSEAAQGIYATVDRAEREAAGAAVVRLVQEAATATPGSNTRPKNAKTPGRSRSETRRSG